LAPFACSRCDDELMTLWWYIRCAPQWPYRIRSSLKALGESYHNTRRHTTITKSQPRIYFCIEQDLRIWGGGSNRWLFCACMNELLTCCLWPRYVNQMFYLAISIFRYNTTIQKWWGSLGLPLMNYASSHVRLVQVPCSTTSSCLIRSQRLGQIFPQSQLEHFQPHDKVTDLLQKDTCFTCLAVLTETVIELLRCISFEQCLPRWILL
jgi:hypothetical protein